MDDDVETLFPFDVNPSPVDVADGVIVVKADNVCDPPRAIFEQRADQSLVTGVREGG